MSHHSLVALAQAPAPQGERVLLWRVRIAGDSGELGCRLGLSGLEWSAEEDCYLLAEPQDDMVAALDILATLPGPVARSADVAGVLPSGAKAAARRSLDAVGVALLEQYVAALVAHKYSPKTCKSYKNAFRSYMLDLDGRRPETMPVGDVEAWLQARSAGDCSATHVNLLINAVRFYYVSMLGLPAGDYAFARPKHTSSDPETLSKTEVQLLLQNTPNAKHRCLLVLAYGAGLRLNEVLNLRRVDMDLDRMMLCVRGGKLRRQGREVPLGAKLVEALRSYLLEFNPSTWLFEGERRGSPYSERSAQMVVKQSATRAGLGRNVSLNVLRHSYATHLLEAGLSVEAVQDLMGHVSIRTTGRYAHIARRKAPASPAEDLEI